MPPESNGIVEYAKHYAALLLSTRRRFDFTDYGGKEQAHTAAKVFISEGTKLMEAWELLRRKPEDRATWIAKNFSQGAADQRHRCLDLQKVFLVRKLCERNVPWFEAKVMQDALQATPNLKMCKLTLVHDVDKKEWMASVEQNDTCTSEGFKLLKDAKTWLLQMAHASEAGLLTT